MLESPYYGQSRALQRERKDVASRPSDQMLNIAVHSSVTTPGFLVSS